MPELTPKLGLKKPLGNETVSRAAYNENLDIMDSNAAAQSDLNAHTAQTATAHGATSAATASTLMARDANGRAKVAAPSASDDIARKDTVDAHANATSAHSATSAATANRIMMRDANGRAKVAAPAAADDIARKDTVDNAISSHTGDADPHPQYATDTAVAAYFDPITGHKHTGIAGDGPSLPLTEIGHIALTSPATSIVFTGLDSDIHGGYLIIIRGKLTAASGIRIYFNGDTSSAEYTSQGIYADTSSVSASTVSGSTEIILSDGNSYGSFAGEILAVVNNGTISAKGVSYNANRSSLRWVRRSYNKITQIEIKALNNMAVGTEATLYCLR